MRKSVWIIGGVAIAAVGLTAVGAVAQRGGDGFGYGDGDGWRGGHHGGGYHGRHHGYGERGHGMRHGGRGRHGEGRGKRWDRPATKEDYDAQTRSRFAEWDVNGDGVVDRGEVEARITGRMEQRMERRGGFGPGMRMLRRLDEDRDGTVTKAEVEMYVTRMFTQMDLDGDGRITDNDLPPMMRGLDIIKGERPDFAMGGGQHGWGHRGHGRRANGRRGGMPMLRHMLGADANKDGEITIEEAQNLAAKRVGRFDRNGDGNIDEADREALRAEIIDYRVRRFLHRFGADQEKGLTMEQFKTYRDERFARRDLDDDGVITRHEMRGGRGHGAGHGGPGRGERGEGRGRGRGPGGGEGPVDDERR
jgi:Ca2+-binding EF-hand superfamily protein